MHSKFRARPVFSSGPFFPILLLIFSAHYGNSRDVGNSTYSLILGQENNGTSMTTTRTANEEDLPLILCSMPPLVPNSRVHYPNRQVGSVATYTCFAAYKAIGTPPLRTNVTCLPDGRWSPADFACVSRRQLDDEIAFADEEPADPGIPNDAMPLPVSLLFSEQQMPMNMPLFTGAFCNNVPRIPHATIVEEGSTSFSTAVGSRLSFMCDPGYYLAGSAFVECMPSLNWSSTPSCQPFCLNPPIVSDSVQKVTISRPGGKYFTSGERVEYTCKSGYVLVARTGDASFSNNTVERFSTCQPDGSWSDPPACLPIEMEEGKDGSAPAGLESCGPPPPTRHGNVSLAHTPSFFAVGETALYACHNGYRLVGPAVIECMHNLKWSMNPTCVPASLPDTCPSPPGVTDSIHVKANPDTGWIAGETVLYLCQRGFYRIGDPVIQCQPSGQWTTPPKCILQNAEVTFPPSSRLMAAGSEWGSTGTTGGSSFQCQPPPFIQNGFIIQVTPTEGKFPPGTVATYRCDPAFTLFGQASIRCSEYLVWQTPPVCLNAYETTQPLSPPGSGGECPSNPTTPPNTQIVERYMPTPGRATIGSFIVLDCIDGYEMSDNAGSPILWCDSNFRWQQQDPPLRCNPKLARPATTPMIPSWQWQPPANNVFQPSNGNGNNGNIYGTGGYSNNYGNNGRFGNNNGAGTGGNGYGNNGNQNGNSNYNYGNFGNNNNGVGTGGTGFGTNGNPNGNSNNNAGFGNNNGAGGANSNQNGNTNGNSNNNGGGFFNFATLPDGEPDFSFLTDATTLPPTGTTEVPSCTPPPEIPNGFMVKITRPSYSNGREANRKNVLYYYGVTVTYVCVTGYYFLGSSVIMCQRSGEWSGIPVCQPSPTRMTTAATVYWYTEHPVWLPPSNDATTTQVSTTTTTATTTEPTLTELTEEATDVTEVIEVTAPLEVSEQNCDLPPVINDGLVIARSPTLGPLLPGSSVTYSCMGDTELVGSNLVHCLPNGMWEMPPVCVPLPTTTTTSRTTSTKPTTTTPKPTTTTSTTTTTTTTKPTTTTTTKSTTKTTTTTTTTTPEITTEESAPEETTEPPQQECKTPPAIPNGELVYILPLEYAADKTYYVGTAATYGCVVGYRMIGTPTAYCGNDLNWHGIPVCASEPTTTPLAKCPAPPNVQNGFIINNSAPSDGAFNPGSSVQYQCNPGYRMIGFPRIFCTFELKWETAPICDFIPTTPPTTQPTATTTTKSPVTAPPATQAPTTAPTSAQTCPSPPLVSYATLIAAPSPPYTMGTIARYSCAPGYALMGPDSVVCLPYSTWSRPPECIPFSTTSSTTQTPYLIQQDCQPPPLIPYGTSSVAGMANQKYSPGSAVVYSCSQGYALVGTPIALCAANGQWSTPPSCVSQNYVPSGRSALDVPKRICPEPPGVLHGYRASQMITDATLGWQTGDSFETECFPPYIRLGRPKAVCSEAGTWSSTPTCVRANTNPRSKASSNNNNNNNNNNQNNNNANLIQLPNRPRHKVVEQSQQSTHNQKQSQQQQQQSQQQSQHTSMQVMCDQPPAVVHAVAVLRSGVGQMPGSAYLYICEPPFKLRGSPTVICGSNGQWSALPSCEPDDEKDDDDDHGNGDNGDNEDDNNGQETSPAPSLYCGPPPTIDNGNVQTVPATAVVGSVVSYECQPHFQMRGPYTVSCMPSGRWSMPPTCIPLPSSSQRNNRANVAPPPARMSSGLVKQGQLPRSASPVLFSSRFDTPSSLLFSAFSSPCYGGPDWPAKLSAGQLSTKLATRELHIFREVVFNCTGLIVEWRYISVLPLKSEPVIVYFGIWRLVHPRGLKYRLVGATKVTIVGSVRPEETMTLKLHEAEYLHVEPGDVFGLHYDEGASSQQAGAIPLAYTFSPSPFTQPQLSSTLASLDDHASIRRRQLSASPSSSHKTSSAGSITGDDIIVDFDNYGFRFFRLPFVKAVVHMI